MSNIEWFTYHNWIFLNTAISIYSLKKQIRNLAGSSERID